MSSTSRRPVSVAMTTFNGARHLGEQLDSLAGQDHLPAELVVVDDGSTDDTMAQLEAFRAGAPFPVRIRRNERRLGWVDNTYAAIRACRHELIAPCDQDDVWLPEKLKRCAALLDSEQVVLVVHEVQTVGDDLQPFDGLGRTVDADSIIAPADVPIDFAHHGMALVFDRRLVTAIDATRRPLAIDSTDDRGMFHDRWLCFVAPLFGPVATIQEPLVLYRRHESNASALGSSATTAANALEHVDAKVDRYRMLAARQRAAAELLRGLAAEDAISTEGKECARTRAAFLDRRSTLYNHRAHVVAPDNTRAGALLALVNMIGRGGYAARSPAGFGVRSLAVDAAIVTRRLVQRRSAGASAN